ncbi:MAG TPA: hypothetical protein VH092_04800, partial [Urbifossiella sp.]|nr:hypothetical protein [Urbifossiella sp.]
MTRPFTSAARPLALAAALAALAGIGCGSKPPAVGGADTPKARENRKLAESYAVAAAVGGATAEVRAHPEMEKKSKVSKVLGWFSGWAHPSMPVSTSPTPPTPPAPPPLPAPPQDQEPAPLKPVIRIEAAARPVPPPSGSILVRERVASELPLPTEAEAEDATLAAAAERLSQAFSKFDPPLDYRPSPAAVKADF